MEPRQHTHSTFREALAATVYTVLAILMIFFLIAENVGKVSSFLAQKPDVATVSVFLRNLSGSTEPFALPQWTTNNESNWNVTGTRTNWTSRCLWCKLCSTWLKTCVCNRIRWNMEGCFSHCVNLWQPKFNTLQNLRSIYFILQSTTSWAINAESQNQVAWIQQRVRNRSPDFSKITIP